VLVVVDVVDVVVDVVDVVSEMHSELSIFKKSMITDTASFERLSPVATNVTKSPLIPVTTPAGTVLEAIYIPSL